jgi:hypothetical protein
MPSKVDAVRDVLAGDLSRDPGFEAPSRPRWLHHDADYHVVANGVAVVYSMDHMKAHMTSWEASWNGLEL